MIPALKGTSRLVKYKFYMLFTRVHLTHLLDKLVSEKVRNKSIILHITGRCNYKNDCNVGNCEIDIPVD